MLGSPVQDHQKIALALSFSLMWGLGGQPPRGTMIFGVPRRYFGAKMHKALASKKNLISILKNIAPFIFWEDFESGLGFEIGPRQQKL